jgi:acetyl-CoA carboxylase biotin carboxylase subunit
MRRALLEYKVEGIKTNIAFFLDILTHPDFRNGDFDTGFIERWVRSDKRQPVVSDLERDFAALAATLFHSSRPLQAPEMKTQAQSAWKLDGRKRAQRSR